MLRIICGWGKCGSILLSDHVSRALGMEGYVFREFPEEHGPEPCIKTHSVWTPQEGFDTEYRAVFMFGQLGPVVGSYMAQSIGWLVGHGLNCNVDLRADAAEDPSGEAIKLRIARDDVFNLAASALIWSREPRTMFVAYEKLWNWEIRMQIERHLQLPHNSLVEGWPERRDRATTAVVPGSGYQMAQDVVQRRIRGILL